MLIKSDLLFRDEPEERKQLKIESTAQARFLSIFEFGFLFRRFVGDFLPSFEPLYAAYQFYGLFLKLWQRDTNWRLLARRPMGIVVSFVFRSMRLKIVLKFPASGFLLGDFFAMVICSEICQRLSCYYAWCLLFAGIYLVLKYLRF